MVGVSQDTIAVVGQAAAHGNLRSLCSILDADRDWIDTFNSRGATALIRAIELNQVAVVRELVARGANINLSTIDGWSPLHHCAHRGRGHYECLQALLESGRANVDQENADGNAALNLCAMNDFCDCAELLLDHGADVNHLQNLKWTPIMQACSRGRGYLGMVKLLIKRGAKLDLQKSDGDTVLGLCCLHDWRECAEALVRAKANVNIQKSNRWSPLMHCCGKGRGHAGIARMLLAAGADAGLLNDDGNSALAVCAMNGFGDIAKLLLAHGAKVDCRSNGGWGILHQTVCRGRGSPAHLQVAALLLRHGADVNMLNNDRNSALNLAAIFGFEDIAHLLVSSGADVNNTAKDGWAPLHCCVGSDRGHVGIARLLISHGADLDAATKDSSTALALCAKNGFAEIAGLLLAAGADPDTRDDLGWTALMQCAAAGRQDRLPVARLLLGAGDKKKKKKKNRAKDLDQSAPPGTPVADASVADAEGFTVLHLAALHGMRALAAAVLAAGPAAGADVNARLATDGSAPLHNACSEGRGFAGVAKVLLRAPGSEVDAEDDQGWTPLMLLADWDSPVDLLTLLVEQYGADVNKVSPAGLSPLLLAAQGGRLEHCQRLVQLGARLGCAPVVHGVDKDLRRECPQGHPLQSTTAGRPAPGSTVPPPPSCSACGAQYGPGEKLRYCAQDSKCCASYGFALCGACSKRRRRIQTFASPLQAAAAAGHAAVVEWLELRQREQDQQHDRDSKDGQGSEADDASSEAAVLMPARRPDQPQEMMPQAAANHHPAGNVMARLVCSSARSKKKPQ